MAREDDLFAPPSEEEILMTSKQDDLFAPPSEDELFAPPSEEDLLVYDKQIEEEPNILESLFNNSPSEIRPVAGSATGFVAGSGAKKAIETVGSGLKTLAKPVLEGSRQVPIIGDITGAAKYAAEGKSVVGKGLFGGSDSTRNKIVDESLDLVKEYKDLVKKQKSNSSKKIGKLIKLTDSKVSPSNYNEILNNIERELDVIQTPTEESLKSKNELKALLQKNKDIETKYNVVSKKQVKTGIQEAKDKLKELQSKLKMEAEELGEIKSFGPTKESANRVSSLDLQKGKVISVPIKSGEYTPIDINKLDKEFFSKMDTQDLKNLQISMREIKDSAPENSQMYTKLIKAEEDIKNALYDRVEKGLGTSKLEAYKTANKQYASAKEMEELIPNLSDSRKVKEIQVSNFLRSIEDDNKSADVKNQMFRAFMDESSEDPVKLKILQDKTRELADRYNLSDLTRKIGIDSTSLRNLGVRVGDVAGKLYKGVKTVAKAGLSTLPFVGAGVGYTMTMNQAMAQGATEEEAREMALEQTVSDQIFGLFSPERAGPMESLARKQESGEKLTEEEERILKERLIKTNNEIMKKTTTDFNKAADEIEKLDNGRFKPVANQVRSLANKKDERVLKANAHVLQSSQGYKELEKFLEKQLGDISEQNMTLDPKLQEEDNLDNLEVFNERKKTIDLENEDPTKYNYDSLNFKDAFNAARMDQNNIDDGIFEWRGKKYTTALNDSDKIKVGREPQVASDNNINLEDVKLLDDYDQIYSNEDLEIEKFFDNLKKKEGIGDKTGAAETGNYGITQKAIDTLKSNKNYSNYIDSNYDTLKEIDNLPVDQRSQKYDQLMRLYVDYLNNKMPNNFKGLPDSFNKAILDSAYNIGESVFNYEGLGDKIKEAKKFKKDAELDGQFNDLEKNEYKEKLAKALKVGLFDVLNATTKKTREKGMFKGLAKRRAESYNEFAKEESLPLVKFVKQENNEIKYLDKDRKVIYIQKGKIHSQSKDGEIELK